MDIAVPVVARLERFFSQFDTLQSLIIATWLFPELRQIIANGCEGGCRDVFLDPELLRHYGLRAWHHDQWEVGAAELKAIDAQKPSNRRRKK